MRALDALELDSDADFKAIKAAHRRLVKETHPDANPGDAEAAKRFKQVQAAYDVLREGRRAEERQGGLGRGGVALGGLLHERDHVGYALGAVGAEMLAQLERRERFGDVDRGDLGRGLVLDRRKDQRDDALGDRGIAVGEEVQPAVARRSDRPTPKPSSRAPWSRRS